MRRALIFAVILGLGCDSVAAPPPAPPSYDSAFWATWGDGKAELAGYTLTRPRYGAGRSGTLVTIVVNEPFSRTDNVKAEGKIKRPKSDVMNVLKLNVVEKFQTGIYDYQLVTSAFVTIDGAPGRAPGSTTKVATSVQEWCGITYHEVTFDQRGGVELLRSYFEGESRSAPLRDVPQLTQDAAWLWARGLASPLVAPGKNVAVTVLTSLAESRLLHVPLTMPLSTLSRADKTESATVSAGTFTVRRASVTSGDGDARQVMTFFVEEAAPHRIIKVERTDGWVAELTGSRRGAYWTEQKPGDDALLQELGLKAGAP